MGLRDEDPVLGSQVLGTPAWVAKTHRTSCGKQPKSRGMQYVPDWAARSLPPTRCAPPTQMGRGLAGARQGRGFGGAPRRAEVRAVGVA
jgi:hypothetical protein